MTKIILVDDHEMSEPGLADCLKRLRPDWNTVTLNCGEDVLRLAKKQEFDCIITNENLSDMAGAELLQKLRREVPDVVGLTTAKHNDQIPLPESTSSNHRLLNRSLPEELQVKIIDSTLRLSYLLKDPGLKQLIADVHSLPPLPTVYSDLVEELSMSNSSLQRVGSIIEEDTALTATVLKMVNSAFYGLNQSVESVAQAVALLGAHMIKNVTLTAKVFMHFQASDVEIAKLRQLNGRANRNGALCNQFARLAQSSKTIIDHAQMAGMMCNVGELVELLLEAPQTSYRSEQIGARLLSDWLMPVPVVEAIAMQNETLEHVSSDVTPLMILHSVCYLERCYPDVSDDAARLECLDVLAQRIDKQLAERWLEAYADLQLLSSHQDVDTTNVSKVA